MERTINEGGWPESGRQIHVRPIDHRSVDWPRVCRAVYQVRQHYRYTYTAPVTDIKQRLVMIPVDRYGDQRLLTYHLDVRGWDAEPRKSWEADTFGNRIAHVTVGRVDH
ncbi:MAG TPA: transglutaminase N-terminal domain-containing protein, partial [Dehalococcoidia bacterium]|nr:transglutaminase N-terminal domain-containing protein [Dehalococcoidia bacterium]